MTSKNGGTGWLALALLASEMSSPLRRIVAAFEPVVEARSRQPAFYECLVRMEQADGQALLAPDIVLRVYHAMALDPALPFEGRRYDIYPEMRLAEASKPS